MARKKSKKKKKRRYQRGSISHRRSLLDSDRLVTDSIFGTKFIKDTRYPEGIRKRVPREHKRHVFKRFREKEREALVRRFTPGPIARAKEIRNILESTERWICTKRRSRREGLFGSGSIGKNKIVSKLRRMTIESLVDCRRR